MQPRAVQPRLEHGGKQSAELVERSFATTRKCDLMGCGSSAAVPVKGFEESSKPAPYLAKPGAEAAPAKAEAAPARAAEAAAATAEPASTTAPAAGGGKQQTEERPASEADLDAAAALIQGAMATLADESWTTAAASEAELDQAAALIQGAVEAVADKPPAERLW